MQIYLLVALFSISIGIETGAGIPVAGLYNQVSSSQIINLFLNRKLGGYNLEIAAGLENFNTTNSEYLLEDYSFLAGFSRRVKFIQFMARIGGGRIRRELNTGQEKGFSLVYDFNIGFPVNFEQVLIAPGINFRGLSDFTTAPIISFIALRIGYVL